MNDKPLVTFIIPTYNRGGYVLNALNSVLSQTYKNIEILVIDDCSIDDTEKIIKGLNNNRISYYKNDINSGPCFSRNRGIGLSNGEYINFLDDDDTISPKKVELQIEKFMNSKIKNVGVITSDIEYRRSDINRVKKNRKKGYIYKDLLKGYCVSGTQQMLIKKEVLKNIKFDEGLDSNQEYDLMIQISKKYNFDFIDYLGAIQNESENQISFNFRKKLSGTRYLYKKYKGEYKNNNLFCYNFIRFNYLFLKYSVGIVLGKKIYLLLP